MEKPNELWNDTVDIAETTTADFESRNRSANIWDPNSVYRNIATAMSQQWDMHRSEALDYCLRVYIGYYCDTLEDCRDVVDQTMLVPPKGWVRDNKSGLPTVDASINREPIGSDGRRQIIFQTTESIYEILTTIVESDDSYENGDDFIKEAITFVFDGYESFDSTIDERPQTE